MGYSVCVWNCRASLVRWTPSHTGMTFEELENQPPEELLHEAIYEAGGGINLSGHYPLTENLESWLLKVST